MIHTSTHWGRDELIGCIYSVKRVDRSFCGKNEIFSAVLPFKSPQMLSISSGRHYCPKCFKSYKHRTHLNAHIRHECGGKEPRFNCELCSYRSHQKGNIKKHAFNVHKIIIQ